MFSEEDKRICKRIITIEDGWPEMHSEPSQISKIKLYAKKVKLKLLTIFTKSSVLDVCLDPEYAPKGLLNLDDIICMKLLKRRTLNIAFENLFCCSLYLA